MSCWRTRRSSRTVLEVAGRPLRTGYVDGSGHHARGRSGTGTRLARDDRGRGDRPARIRDGAPSRPNGTRFYARFGWERWQGPTFVRETVRDEVRSEVEDDGIMVLRFGRQPGHRPQRTDLVRGPPRRRLVARAPTAVVLHLAGDDLPVQPSHRCGWPPSGAAAVAVPYGVLPAGPPRTKRGSSS